MIIDQRSRITDTVSFIAASGAVLGWDEVALSAQLFTVGEAVGVAVTVGVALAGGVAVGVGLAAPQGTTS